LQIGAGPNILEGWLNSDQYPTSRGVVFLNATKPFPFEDCTFDYILSEHQIEHLTYKQGLFMLGECYRVLKPGGKMRVATPDLQTLIGLYAPERSDLQQRYIRWITDKFLPQIGIYSECFVINSAFRDHGHQFIYDHATLESAMEEVGFVDIARYAPGESDDETLRGIESHGKSAGNEDMNRFETMVLEAKRP
jgi:predicted SAM-dependent methyltransferase